MFQKQPIQLTPLTKPLRIHFTGAQAVMPPELSDKIAAHWVQLTHQNPHLFNGEAFTVTSYADNPDAIEVELAETKYAHNLYSEAYDAGEYAFRVIHSACLVITSDNKFVVGQMGERTARAGIICCSGGGIDRGDIRGDSIDLDYSTTHELQEELGIDPHGSHAESFGPAYIKTCGPLGKITVLYELRTSLTSSAFAENYEKFVSELAAKGEEIEFGQLFFVDNTRDAIEAFIVSHEGNLDEYIPLLLRAENQRAQ
jgi:hypothetical protein